MFVHRFLIISAQLCLRHSIIKHLLSNLGEQNFIKQLINFDKDGMTDRVLKKIGQYCSQPDFHPEIIGRVSLAAKSLCMWVRAMEVYGRIYRYRPCLYKKSSMEPSILMQRFDVLSNGQ